MYLNQETIMMNSIVTDLSRTTEVYNALRSGRLPLHRRNCRPERPELPTIETITEGMNKEPVTLLIYQFGHIEIEFKIHFYFILIVYLHFVHNTAADLYDEIEYDIREDDFRRN